MTNRIFSILVNWNLKDDTLACVQSLVEAGAPLNQIVVVDNHSSDGSVTALRERFGAELQHITSDRNLGYAGGVNLGIEPALQAGADWIFLLNNDTKMSPEIFTALERAIADNPEYAIFAPVIFYYDEPDLVWFYGDDLIGDTLLTRPLVKDIPLPSETPNFQPVDFVSGCGVIIRGDVFEEIGLFDADLFMYGEEVDFLWRARQAGFRSAVVRDAVMWHKVSHSANKVKPLSRYYRVRNQNLFYRRYSTGISRMTLFLFSIIKTLSIGLKDLVRGNLDLIAPLFSGWAAGWFRSPEPHP